MKREQNKIDLFLDSGAYSAKTQGVTIEIEDYIEFIRTHEQVIQVYACLDVIGDPDATMKNLRIMEAAGLNPLPVFHYGSDPEKYLKPLIGKYDYICIGGMVKSGNLTQFLDTIFAKYLCDEKGMPKIKVHGFGLTSLSLMMRYPWYSVDSTSWVVTGRLGSIYVPRFRGGEYVYDENSLKIAVSNRSPNQTEAGKHIDTLSPLQKKIVLDYIHSKGYWLGASEFREEEQSYELKENERWGEKKPLDKKAKRKVELILEKGISNTYQLRDEMNILYFLDLEKNMPKWPWAFELKSIAKGLF